MTRITNLHHSMPYGSLFGRECRGPRAWPERRGRRAMGRRLAARSPPTVGAKQLEYSWLRARGRAITAISGS